MHIDIFILRKYLQWCYIIWFAVLCSVIQYEAPFTNDTLAPDATHGQQFNYKNKHPLCNEATAGRRHP